MSRGEPAKHKFDRNGMVAAFQNRFRWAYRALEETEGGERISQAEIGRRMAERLPSGRSPAAVSEWWTGKSIPDTITMAALADILEVSPGWLAFGEGDAVPEQEERGPRVSATDLRSRKDALDDAIATNDQAEGG